MRWLCVVKKNNGNESYLLGRFVQVMARINYNMSMRNIRILEDTFDKKVFNDVALHPYRHGVGERLEREWGLL